MPIRRTRRAFTLLEIVITVLVIVVLIGLAAFAYTGFREDSRDVAAQTTLRQIATAVIAEQATSQVAATDSTTFATQVQAAASGAHPAAVSAGGTSDGDRFDAGTDPSTSPTYISVAASPERAGLALLSPTGRCAVAAITGTKATTRLWNDVGANCDAQQVLDRGLDDEPGHGGEPVPVVRPTIVSATVDRGTGQATVTWTFDGTATSYAVHVGAGPDPVWTGTATTATFPTDGLDAGEHEVRVTAHTGSGDTVSEAGTLEIDADFNDDYASAWRIHSPAAEHTETVDLATMRGSGREADEESLVTHSVWHKLTPAHHTTYVVTVESATYPGEGQGAWWPGLTVHTGGTSPGTSTPVAATELRADSTGRVVKFVGDPAKTYHLRVYVDNANGYGYRITVRRGAENDMFAHPKGLDAPAAELTEVSTTGTLRTSTAEPGEANNAKESLWYAFTPNHHTNYRVDVTSTALDGEARGTYWPGLSIHTGGTDGGSTAAVPYRFSNTSSAGTAYFVGEPGKTYYVRVFVDTQGNGYGFRLGIRRGPDNDMFAEARTLPDLATTTFVEDATLSGTSAEDGESNNAKESLWYSWTATQAGTYEFTATSMTFPDEPRATWWPGLSVHTGGTSAGSTGTVPYTFSNTSSHATLRFSVEVGTTYKVRVFVDTLNNGAGFRLNARRLP